MLTAIVAGACSLAAIALIYKSWRTRAPAFFYLGSGVLVLSCVAWSYSQGWEHGIVYALCLPALLVWPYIGVNQTQLTAPKQNPVPKPLDTSLKTVSANIGHTLVVLVLLLLTSLLSTLALCLRLPTETTGKLALVIVFLPVVWGLLVYHYFAVQRKFLAIFTYVVLTLLSTLVLVYVPV